MNARRIEIVAREVANYILSLKAQWPEHAEMLAFEAALQSETSYSLPVRGTNRWGITRIEVSFASPHQPTFNAWTATGVRHPASSDAVNAYVTLALGKRYMLNDVEILLIIEELEAILKERGEATNKLTRGDDIAIACALHGVGTYTHTMHAAGLIATFHQMNVWSEIVTVTNRVTGQEIDAESKIFNARLRRVVEF